MDTFSTFTHEQPRIDRFPHRTTLFDERARRAPPSRNRRRPSGTYQTGLLGESVVADELQRDGWRILGHRVRTRVGEIDLVARRGDTVVFAEVKTAGPGRIEVEQSVSPRAQLRIRRAAVAWMGTNPRLHAGARRFRFDVFFVYRDAQGGITRVERVRDAF